MSRTWHRHKDVRASVRPCLGHGADLDFDIQCKTMFGTWHRYYTLCLRLNEYPIAFQMVQR
ncbi:hypothetical protein F383_29658 [Gossypium arboreum]|uniref:Uncharacterized protein n=1 Tax=Gossypium arboreum TaxID=29729 RepID=A0A0B0MUI5_GOSAR|nr:hypothetical protein F383_29658 [Gossypium arboreum]